MQTATAGTLEQITSSAAPTARAARGRNPRTTALVLLGAGVATMAVTALTLVTVARDGGTRESGAIAPATAAESAPGGAAPGGLTIQSAGDISVLNMTYEAGQSSGWHAHRGIHAVAILSGELAVYDTNCVRTVYGPDNPYVGGQHLHLIRNETGAAVPMVVTYVNPVASPAAHVPSGTPSCSVS